jgi:hypothetical protein
MRPGWVPTKLWREVVPALNSTCLILVSHWTEVRKSGLYLYIWPELYPSLYC